MLKQNGMGEVEGGIVVGRGRKGALGSRSHPVSCSIDDTWCVHYSVPILYFN